MYAGCPDLHIDITTNHKYLGIITAFVIKVLIEFNNTEKYHVMQLRHGIYQNVGFNQGYRMISKLYLLDIKQKSCTK